MTETEAKFELLKVELQSIQLGIRGIDTILFQIRGWCVTVTLAVAGLALTNKRPALLLLGVAAVVGFWVVDAQNKTNQRVHARRDREIQRALMGQSPLAALESGELVVPGLASGWDRGGFRSDLSALSHEARKPTIAGFYCLIVILLGVEALVMR